ncbi:MAG TPA: hypothetical protein VNN72_29490 [Polyangiaceae bacterium]|nr:hypothetical protein [Polyangiaceae bacterium]
MAAGDPTEVASYRTTYQDARLALDAALYLYEKARSELEEAQRTGESLGEFQMAFASAESAFNDAKDYEVETFGLLQQALDDFLPDSTSTDSAAADADIAHFESKYPIVLFPVRVETRFDGGYLKVRLSPDEISLYTHESRVTPSEDEAGVNYWQGFIDEKPETELWRDIVARVGAPRAAYLVPLARPDDPKNMEGTGGPHWPTLDRRSSSWTKPGVAMMPDRFAVYVYKNGTRRGPYYGGRVVEPLQVTPDPKLREGDLVDFPPGHKIDPRIQWNVNFDTVNDVPFENALKVGMGVLVPLEGDDATTGFDRVVVVGVKSSMGSSNGAAMISQLFYGHRYTTGFEFLRQGTATNNIEGQPTTYPPEDHAGEVSYVYTLLSPSLYTGTDAEKFQKLLKVPQDLVTHVQGREGVQIANAQAMNRALWPATFGYFMRFMLAPTDSTPTFSKEDVELGREYFCNHVLARGVVPAIRVGSIPYGVLPVAALGTWEPRSFGITDTEEVTNAKIVEAAVLEPLKNLFGLWHDASAGVPRIQSGRDNPDVDLAEVLATYPSSKQFRVRWGIGKDVQGLHFTFFGWDLTSYFLGLELQSADSFATIGRSTWRPRLGYTLFDDEASTYTGEIVAPLPLSEDTGLASNFIQGILNAAADIATVNAGTVEGAPGNENLLYSVLRHSTLMAWFLGYDRNITLPDYEYFLIPSMMGGPPPTLQQVIDANPDLNTLPGGDTHCAALGVLANLPTAELERLFTETLDLSSHRLDAWVTAFAKRRIEHMRSSTNSTQNYFGAYGWLEDVRPGDRPVVNVPGLGDVPTQAESGGFVHAPSMTQASAAAILRSGHMSAKVENGTQSAGTYAVDLSSRRVRLGRKLFEGVRNGQPLGALLGYEFERSLHESDDASDLDPIRFALRALFPLVANQSGQDGDEPAGAIAARNVVDGARLLNERGSIPWGTGIFPAPDTTQYNAINDALDALAEMFDATADLLTAEGVYQLVRGNIDAAMPTINNIVEGGQPPDTVISRSTRGGVGVSHRVVLAFPSDVTLELPDDEGWPAVTPRASAEPVLNAWIGQIIGDPRDVKAELTYLDADGDIIQSTPSGGTPVDKVTVSLDELGLHPLDLLALAQVIAKKNSGSSLDQRIIAVALNDPDREPNETPSRFELTYDVTGARGFLDLMEILNTVARVLSNSRPLKPEDLLTPADTDDVLDSPVIPDVAAKAFYERADLVRLELSGTITVLGDALAVHSGFRAALLQAAQFAPLSAFPDPTTPDDELEDLVRAWRKTLQAKYSGLPTLTSAQLETLPGKQIIEKAFVILKAVLGEDVLAIPPLNLPRAQELSRSLAARGELLAGDEEAPDRYLQQIMRTRDKMRYLRKLGLYARTAGMPRPRVDVIQLPYRPGDPWLGLPFETPPEEGRSALLVLNYTSGLSVFDVTWSGLFIDGWTEIIPNQVEDTGIAFNYEGPRGKAPQSILVAAPARTGDAWAWEDLLQSVEQTFDLAQMRAVDRDLLGIGQLIPAAIFTTNENPDNTVSTVFSSIAQPPPDEQALEQ